MARPDARRATPNAVPGTRRAFLGGTLACACTLIGRRPAVMPGKGNAMAAATPRRDAGALDEALALLHRTGPEFGGGLANHGPMAAEALVALGREADVLPWVRGYLRRLDQPPAPWQEVARDEWRAALGDSRHAADWPRFFEIELREHPWPEVLDLWVQRLAPGLAAAAAHGVLRTAHAVRALAARDTPERRAELAAGLGYWATRYQTLPARGPAPADARGGRVGPLEALEHLPRLPEDQRRAGLISEELRALEALPAFAAAADEADLAGAPEGVLSQACLAFARAYLADGGRELFAFIHAVTGPSALRLLLPHLSPATQRAALYEAWRLGAAVYSAFGRSAPAPAAEGGTPPTCEALIEAALGTRDEHAIKLTEACLREHAVLPAGDFLAVARDACRRFGARSL